MAIENIPLGSGFADHAVETLERLLGEHETLIAGLPPGDEKDDAENVLSIMVDALNEFRQYRQLCEAGMAGEATEH